MSHRIQMKPIILPRAISALLALLFTPMAFSAEPSAAVKPAGHKRLEDFDYRGVSIDGGRFRLLIDQARDDYLRIPNDDLLKGFRQRAGLPAPGNNLGGWYSGDVFHVFGQIVSGLARLHAATGDPACRDKVNTLVAEWAKCIGPDGYFYFSLKPNAPHYIYDKTVGGLVDAHLYCGSPEALSALSKITDWAIKHLDRSRKVNDTSTEWYTLSENLYRAYLATGNEKYRDFAEVWEYSDYWNIYARGASLFAPRPDGHQNGFYHAYSHVNTLGGAGTAYLVKGQPRYLNLLKDAYDSLQTHQCFATGGYGPDEQLLPRESLLGKLPITANTFETQCGTWAAFKMAKQLICYTGDAEYGNWVERLAINGIGASTPMTADGRVFYYSDYNPNGGKKQNCNFGWSCCTGTRPQATADLDDLVFFHDSENLNVNLFAPATVKWSVGGAAVTVRQETRFPEEAATQFVVSTNRPATFGIKLRTPSWLAGEMQAKVNGRPAELKADGHGWTGVHREWAAGDVLQLTLPMRLHFSILAGPKSDGAEKRYPAAILYGPVVMAARAPNPGFVRKLDLEHLADTLKPVPGEPLTWRLAADPEVLFRPFYAYKEGEPYYLYLDPAAGRRLPHNVLVYRGVWTNAGQFHFSNDVGAVCEGTFEGTGVRWLGYRFDDAGQ
ncbi:MAG TPA: beta-L-arabinofuranosidase domain-containing protein, partial [Pirellulales bacterium]|nr:beta-L-arabinofuranosidase domain-containing protein [Pirellulales bacterium]